MREKIVAIQALLAAAQEENEYGGGEDSEGCLYPGNVDFDELEERIICVLEDREYIPPKPWKAGVPAPTDPNTTWVRVDDLPLDEHHDPELDKE
jgi:hypothetical protein